MQTLVNIWHWLFDYQDPVQLYGIVPVIAWCLIFLNWGLTFGPAEYMGANRWHGMCYATDVLRCLPRAFWIAAAGVAFWHFDFHRVVGKAIRHLFF